MPVPSSTTPTVNRIDYAAVDALFLDPTNPRLGRRVAEATLSQSKVLDAMKDWTLEELAVSFAESGFWPQEALIVVSEQLYGEERLVVVEGNRRLAALKTLKAALDGTVKGRTWIELAERLPADFFDAVPYIKVESRQQVSAYLGFRHVTGIKEWKPAEKAEYIAKLIEEEGLTYDQVRRKIGSKMPTVRQHYIAYRLLLQMETREEINLDAVEGKFSVLYLSLRTTGVRKYLSVDIDASPQEAIAPVPEDKLEKLENYSRWLFGTDKKEPLFTDSRQVDTFGKILESEDSISYLERTANPSFDVALRKSGAGETNLIEFVSVASDNLQLALAEAHLFKSSSALQRVVKRVAADTAQLVSIFPGLKEEIERS